MWVHNKDDDILPKQMAYETIMQRVMKAARSIFHPEFMNRVDECIVFQPLAVRLQLVEVQKKRADRKMKIYASNLVVEFLGYGARPVKPVIQQYVERAGQGNHERRL